MTKEEVLIEKYSAKIMNWEDAFKHNPHFAQAAHEAMDEWAKQEAIAFGQWMFENWRETEDIANSEKLYELYQKSKK